MNVYLKRKQGHWQKAALVIAGLAIVVITLDFFQEPLRNAFYYATTPINKVVWSASSSVSGFFASLTKFSSLTRELENIKEENRGLLVKINALQEAASQNQSLQTAVADAGENNFQLVLAVPAGLQGDTLFIDKGTEDGISENMPVISRDRALVGKVLKAYRNFSQVTLIFDPQSVVDVKINGEDPLTPPVTGVAKGSGNLSMYLDLVSTESQISQFQTVVTSGQEGTFPRDLLVGKISNIVKNDLQPFQTAHLQPFFDISSIQHVFVITNYKRPN